MMRGLFDMLWPIIARSISLPQMVSQMVPQLRIRPMPRAPRHSGVRRQQRAALKRRHRLQQKRSRR